MRLLNEGAVLLQPEPHLRVLGQVTAALLGHLAEEAGPLRVREALVRLGAPAVLDDEEAAEDEALLDGSRLGRLVDFLGGLGEVRGEG